jgi:hypothetical protein
MAAARMKTRLHRWPETGIGLAAKTRRCLHVEAAFLQADAWDAGWRIHGDLLVGTAGGRGDSFCAGFREGYNGNFALADFEYGFHPRQVQDFADVSRGILELEINPGGLQSDQRADSGCVHSGNLPQIQDDILAIMPNRCAQQTGFDSPHQRTFAVQDHPIPQVFFRYAKHGLVSPKRLVSGPVCRVPL